DRCGLSPGGHRPLRRAVPIAWRLADHGRVLPGFPARERPAAACPVPGPGLAGRDDPYLLVLESLLRGGTPGRRDAVRPTRAGGIEQGAGHHADLPAARPAARP